MYPDPVWPVVVVAIFQAVDAVVCIKPLGPIADCLRQVRFPRRYWWLLPTLKGASALGLIAGLWIPYLAAITCTALVVYFALAVYSHVRVRDWSVNLASATVLLAAITLVDVWCLLS